MKKYLFGFIFLFFTPFATNAAMLSIDAQKDEYGLGDSFTATIYLDIDDECINTVETKVIFPPNILLIEDFVSGESLINIWVSEPSEKEIFEANDKGELYIAGGIPGGYCGKIPGDPGDSNLIGRILFRIPGFYVGDAIPEELNISLKDAKVYINDGLGTEDRLRTQNLKLKLNKTSGTEVGDYDAYIRDDKIRPEPFVIELHQNDSVYQGQYFAVFSSIDKQSGIDHYEIIETKKLSAEKTLTEKLIGFFIKEDESQWKIAQTPYLLEDQSLRSIIKVRAIDRAGNERSVEYIPPQPNIEKVLNLDYLIIGLAVILLLIIAFLFFKIAKAILKKTRKARELTKEIKDNQDNIK